MSPHPVHRGVGPHRPGYVAQSGSPSGAGMVNFGQQFKKG
jgi:hypothetical protein